jgi:hypothetical protein
MLLPSALPCDFLAPSLARASAPVVAPYHSPPLEDSGIVSATTTGLLQTCRRLQQILSGGSSSSERLSPSPIPLGVASSQNSRVRKSTPRRAAIQEAPRTPVRRRAPVAPPVRTNKRTRSVAFSSSSSGEESEDSDKDFNRRTTDRFATPPRGKRVRLTTPPPAPNRGIRGLLIDSDDDEDTVMWTDDDDRQLVAMVLGKLRLTKSDWEECARTLGKGDSRSVGKRWEDLRGNIVVKGDRRKRIGQRRIMPRH